MLTIKTIVVTEYAQNCRIMADPNTHSAVVVDPGGEVSSILNALQSAGLTCTQIWLTHSHIDHCGGVRVLQDASGAKLFGHPEERLFRQRVKEIASLYGADPSAVEACPEPDVYLNGGEVIEFGTYKFKVLFTPGHSPGHLAFYNADNKFLFSGDTLFAGSIGRSDLPGGDFDTLMRSINTQLLSLPEDTVVMSGHGEDSTIGKEKRTNPFLNS